MEFRRRSGSATALHVIGGTDIGHDTPDLLCLSHLRWQFVYQRPQHLMTRFARTGRVFFWEEPLFGDVATPRLEILPPEEGVTIARAILPHGTRPPEAEAAQTALLDEFCRGQGIVEPVLWYYTAMALGFSDHLPRALTVYDCMDELTAFDGADPLLAIREQQLLQRADLVFTGGISLYEAKRHQHKHVHAFPSSVDAAHFTPARTDLPEPEDMRVLPHPRIGFCGVIDERLDRALLDGAAALRPDWQFVMVGPVVKIDPATLPRRPNIHYPGPRPYARLPEYLSSWDLAMMPFARNRATRFISPTKTPEYLAAGRPVVSTSITDVVRQYGRHPALRIADTPEAFVAAAETLLALPAKSWWPEADAALAENSWDLTQQRMRGLMVARIAERNRQPIRVAPPRPARIRYDVVVVGAGFAGAVMAERLAASSGKRVLVIDKRPHIGGNAYDREDAAGILIHQYGPHIFHTNAQPVVDYLSRFTKWRPYEHRVLAHVRDTLLPIPINRTTINKFFHVNLQGSELEAFLAAKAEPVETIRTSEDVVVSRVGRELYEAFFRGYTRKQWGIDPSELDKSVTARVPTRTTDDDRYFTDKFQAMPLHGYTRMFEAMLDHPRITLALGADWRQLRDKMEYGHLIFTGPIDEFFDHRHGRLPYRSLRFDHRTLDQRQFQPVAVVNYPSPETPYTRVTEYKHLTGQMNDRTSITYEYPTDAGDPSYPIPRPENAALYARYQALADSTANVSFVGRLGTYRYYNMDQVVGQALALHARLSGERRGSGTASPVHATEVRAASPVLRPE